MVSLGALAGGTGALCSLRKGDEAGGWGLWGLRRWAGLGGTSGGSICSAPDALARTFFSDNAGAGLSGGRLWRDCRALSGMVPAMLRGRGLRGGALGRSTTDADIWLEAIECSEATDRDDLGREGDCCCCCCSLPPAAGGGAGPPAVGERELEVADVPRFHGMTGIRSVLRRPRPC